MIGPTRKGRCSNLLRQNVLRGLNEDIMFINYGK